ncbi:hypothetical protein BU24DRAFT_427301 [Aaosphaeria arxii CBS 175.79]|uniref:Rhodopsin domain-containing protein n=1 Tax=Aaosphaeria arxii CBS 175.79 TaxID=1450172 RepID=A0A6A5XDK4_9PLEO|nr:uncharacterized protein BU24DRAFT_427301 [Aaosphaeria arxii CBS 175.79]KAF2011092.1 hypothetical protein BU24DRAFT_427301 [Aaosphaeria arxii CBS 175.79]
MFAAKFAILLQIKHIFTKHQRNFNYYAVHTLLACNFLVYLALFFAFIFACWPREKIWHPHLYGRCISTNASIIATSAINILSDFTILFLPLLSISRLQLPLKKKIGVSTVFAIGLFACIASILRLYYSVKLSQTHDITWAIAPVGMWSLAEFATVIIVGCFPPLPRLWKFLRGHDKPISGAHMSSQEGRIKGSSQASNNKGDKSHEWYTVCRDTDCMYIPLEEQSITNEDRTMRIGQKEDRIPGMNVSLSPLSLTSIRKTTEIGVVTSN